MARVLIVEDEAPIRDGLVALMEQSEFGVSACGRGDEALRILEDGTFDLVLLDLMLQGLHGLDVLRKMRARRDATPVLILTALGAEDDVVAGIEAGADDYVTKPFGVRELVARAKGLMRRPRPSPPRQVCALAGDISLDFESQHVRYPGGEVPLSTREAALLQYLYSHQERAVSREELLVDVWGYRDGTVRTRTVDVHVQQLRAKLRVIAGADRWISTVRGRGYRFVFEGEA